MVTDLLPGLALTIGDALLEAYPSIFLYKFLIWMEILWIVEINSSCCVWELAYYFELWYLHCLAWWLFKWYDNQWIKVMVNINKTRKC